MGKMTANSPDSDAGRSPEIAENNSDDDFEGDFTERDIALEVETDEEREEVVNVNNDYQLLPASSEQDVEFGYSTFDGAEFHTSTSHSYLELTRQHNSHDSTPSTSRANQVSARSSFSLDQANVETIKKIMSDFTLPTTAIPPWANSISDEDLKKVVEEKVSQESNENWAVFE